MTDLVTSVDTRARRIISRRPCGCSFSLITRNAPRPAWLLITAPEQLSTTNIQTAEGH